jgi:hypothetical protein
MRPLISLFAVLLLLMMLPGCSNQSPTDAPTGDAVINVSLTAPSVTLPTDIPPDQITPTATLENTPTPGVSSAVYNPDVEPASTADVIFVRPGGGESAFFLGMDTVEVWAIGRDGSDERILASYNPADNAWLGLIPSPDRRFAAVSDSPGGVLIDFQTGEKLVLKEAQQPSQWVSQYAWSPDSSTIYYALHDSAGQVTLWRQSVNPAGQPEPLQGSLTADGLALYPHLVLPDGRLLLFAGSTEEFFDRALYNPASGQVTALQSTDVRNGWVLDAREGQVVFSAPPPGDTSGFRALYTGVTDASGQLTGAQQITGPGYSLARFLADGKIASIHYAEQPQDGRFVILTPGAAGQMYTEQIIEIPGQEGLGKTGFDVLDPNTLLLTLEQPLQLWLYSLGGDPTFLVNVLN